MQKRRQRLELAHERARSHPHALHALHAPRGYSIAEEKGGRMRRPTAIMRSNVEVARLMAVPGSKQRQLSQDEYGYGEEAPQHLSTTRNKRAEAVDEAHGGGGAAAHGTNGHTTQAPPGEPPLSAKRDRSGGARSGGGRPSGGARHGGSNVHGRVVPLPIVQAVPSVLIEPLRSIVRRNRGVLRARAASTPTVQGAAAMLGRAAAAIKWTKLIVELHDDAQLRKGTDG